VIDIDDFQTFLNDIVEPGKKEKMESIFNYIEKNFPNLKEEIKWNQPMYSDHGTFIIGFSIAKGHIAVAPEEVTISIFENEIKKAGYSYTKGLFRIKWADQVDFNLLYKIIEYNIIDKRDVTSFWRN